jgi:hypothetical protein
MIPVAQVPEPDGFDTRVRQRGNAWLQANPGKKRLPDYWREFKPQLREGFQCRCGYTAMHDSTPGSVDHYLSTGGPHRDLAYEWSNYRFAWQSINATKQNLDEQVLDPYQVGAGWFEVMLPSMQMRITDAVPPEYREIAENTLRKLKLRDGETIIRHRLEWYIAYKQGLIPLEGLRYYAPLIAEAVEREENSGA